MGIADWMRARLAPRRTGPRRTDAGATHRQTIDLTALLGTAAGSLPPTLGEAEARRRFYRWQYAAATAIAEAVVMAPYEVQELEAGRWVDRPGHLMARVLREVNPYMTGAELWYWTVVDCVMVGRSFWRIAQNALGEPAELYPVVGRMDPVFDRDGAPAAWRRTRQGPQGPVEDTIPAREIVYLRFPRFGDPWGGQGAGQAAGAAIQLDDQVLEAAWQTFKQGVFPAAVAVMSEPNPQRRQKFLDQLNETYAGAREAGRVLGISDKVDLKWPPRPHELTFFRSEDSLRDMILATFRVPPALLGLSKDVNRASAEALEYIFAKYNLAPKLRMLEARINQDLFARRYPRRPARLRFADVVPADREARRADREAALRHGVLSVNEARAQDGLRPVAWGGEPLLPEGLAPAGTLARKGAAR